MSATSAVQGPEPRPADGGEGGEPVVSARGASRSYRPTLLDRVAQFISELSTRNNFWHRVCSLIWLPYAFRSGIRMTRTGESTYSAVLPFRKFNRNWYNAMAGAALLGNSEIAGGMYVFGRVGGAYQVVCKNLNYRFLRPCLGPAEYRVTPVQDLEALIASGDEFDITLEMEVRQLLTVFKSKRDRERAKRRAAAGIEAGSGERARRVGQVTVTFHVTPMGQTKGKGRL